MIYKKYLFIIYINVIIDGLKLTVS